MTGLLQADLQAPNGKFAEMSDFYGTLLGLPRAASGYRVGRSRIAFTPADGFPFYHFAMLIPGNRFDAALAWARERVSLLPIGSSDQTVIHFDNWNADSLYFHDPAGNIVELIAHAGVAESDVAGAFGPDELVQLSEVGLVGDKHALVTALVPLGLEVAGGRLDEDSLVFIGPPTSSLIISPVGRGWLPQGRPAEPHPVGLTVLGSSDWDIIAQTHRIRQVIA